MSERYYTEKSLEGQIADLKDELIDVLRDNGRLRAIISAAHGALVDAGDIPLPDMDEDISQAIRQITEERDKALAELAVIKEGMANVPVPPGKIRWLKVKEVKE